MTNVARQISFIILAFLVGRILSRNYKIIINDVKCTVDNVYVEYAKCTVDTSPSGSNRVNIEGQMQKEVKDMRMDFTVNLLRKSNKTIRFFKETNIDACTIMSKNKTSLLMRLFREMTQKYGYWPETCPIPWNYHYNIHGEDLDPGYLPVSVPDTNFRVTLIVFDKRLKFWQTDVDGRIIDMKKTKIHRRL